VHLLWSGFSQKCRIQDSLLTKLGWGKVRGLTKVEKDGRRSSCPESGQRVGLLTGTKGLLSVPESG
jgi:hypothetical protein